MKHGIYIISKDQLARFEDDWFDGQQIDLVTTTYTAGKFDASGITWEPGAGTQNTKQSLQETFGNTDRRMIIAYEFAGGSRGDYAAPARGDYNSRYRSFAKELVDLDMGDTIITPNHEFNESWSAKYPSDPQNYADGYARLVNVMQSVDGADFTFCFAPARNTQGVAPEAWPMNSQYWPGDEPAPLVAPSFYDAGNGVYPDNPDNVTDADRERAWTQKHKPQLEMWLDFAKSRGASLAFREWGLASGVWANNGGTDNPMFINRFMDWIESHDVKFQTYWNGDIDNQKHTIWPESKSLLTEGGQRWQERVAASLGTDSGTDTTTDDSTDTTTDTNALGGYKQPSQGTLNWHVPLNENFKDIEEDIKALNERLSNLE
jgi:hypothetical protein